MRLKVLLGVIIFSFFLVFSIQSKAITHLGTEPEKGNQNEPSSGIKITPIMGKITDKLGSTCFNGSSKRVYIPIPFITDKAGCVKDLNLDGKGDMVDFILGAFRLMLGLGSILTVFMLTYGGFKWIFSGGNSQKINEAKDIIFSSLGSLILIFLTIPIIQIINPALLNVNLNFGEVKIKSPKALLAQMCPITSNSGEEYKYYQLSDPNKASKFIENNRKTLKNISLCAESEKGTCKIGNETFSYQDLINKLQKKSGPVTENSGTEDRCGALQVHATRPKDSPPLCFSGFCKDEEKICVPISPNPFFNIITISQSLGLRCKDAKDFCEKEGMKLGCSLVDEIFKSRKTGFSCISVEIIEDGKIKRACSFVGGKIIRGDKVKHLKETVEGRNVACILGGRLVSEAEIFRMLRENLDLSWDNPENIEKKCEANCVEGLCVDDSGVRDGCKIGIEEKEKNKKISLWFHRNISDKIKNKELMEEFSGDLSSSFYILIDDKSYTNIKVWEAFNDKLDLKDNEILVRILVGSGDIFQKKIEINRIFGKDSLSFVPNFTLAVCKNDENYYSVIIPEF